MAEALARDRFERDGLRFASAGTDASPGRAATGLAMAVMAELGIDLDDHRSLALADLMELRPNVIFVMTTEQESRVGSMYPELADRVSLLDPDGSAIADPYGGDIAAYRRSRDVIEAAVLSRSDDFAA